MLPFDITVYARDYTRRGPLGAPLSLSGTVVANGPGQLEVKVPADHPRVSDLAADGARVVCTYRPDGAAPVVLLSGRVEQAGGGGPRHAPWRAFTVVDDWTVLTDEVQLWPNPTGSLAQQGDEAAYFTRTGPAETVLKALLAPNVTRQGTVLTIPASAGLGATVTARARFHTIVDLMADLTALGILVRVVQEDRTRVLRVSAPPRVAQVLTQASGIVVDGQYSTSAPTVTRVLLAAGGEGTARVLRHKIDTAREAAHGVVLPAFRDARDISPTDPDAEAAYTARMDETLAEGAPTASLSATLAESGWFRFAVAYREGCQVRVQLADGPVIEDYVRQVDFDWTPGGGVSFTPKVGAWSDVADDALIGRVQTLTRAVGALERR